MADLARATEAGITVFAVIPAKAGIQCANLAVVMAALDSGLRRNDGVLSFPFLFRHG
jgi:hypothetical protein